MLVDYAVTVLSLLTEMLGISCDLQNRAQHLTKSLEISANFFEIRKDHLEWGKNICKTETNCFKYKTF